MNNREWVVIGPDKLLWTLADIAAFFQVKESTVRQWIADGEFPSGLRIGANLTWTGQEFACFLLLRGRFNRSDKPQKDAD